MAGPVVSKFHFSEGSGPPGNWRSWLIWGTAAIFYLYEFLVRVAPSVMEHELQEAFQLSAGQLGAALGVYFYVYAPMQIGVGLLLDKFGVKRVLVPAALCCVTGCFLTIATTDVWVLSVARGLMGFGSAFAFVGCMHLAAVWFPASRLAMLSGLTTTLGMAGAIAAQRPMVELVSATGWRGSWIVCGLVGIAVAALIWVFIPKPPPWEIEAKQTEDEDEEARTVWRGLKEVLKNPQTWIIGFISSALYFNLSVLGALWGDDYVVAVTGGTTAEASNAVSMLYVGWLIGGPLSGLISDRMGKRKTVLVVSLLLTLILTTGLLFFSKLTVFQCGLFFLIMGLASSAQIVTFVANLEHNPDWASATAIAVTNMIVMLLGGVAQPLVGMVLDIVGEEGAKSFTVSDYRYALAVMPLMCLLGLIASIFMKESYTLREDSLEALAEE